MAITETADEVPAELSRPIFAGRSRDGLTAQLNAHATANRATIEAFRAKLQEIEKLFTELKAML